MSKQILLRTAPAHTFVFFNDLVKNLKSKSRVEIYKRINEVYGKTVNEMKKGAEIALGLPFSLHIVEQSNLSKSTVKAMKKNLEGVDFVVF